MDLESKLKKASFKKKLLKIFPHDLQMYRFSPSSEISIYEFEDLAIKRLEVLIIFEKASVKGYERYTNEWIHYIKTELESKNLHDHHRLIMSCGSSDSDLSVLQRQRDHISHYILLIAFCDTDELQRWFIDRESEYFKLKFMAITESQDVEIFLKINNLIYTPISKEEKDQLRDELYNSTAGVDNVDDVDFFKVRFSEVPSLVKKRKVFLKLGYAYVPKTEIVVSILHFFRKELNDRLCYASQRINNCDDERFNNLIFILKDFYKRHLRSLWSFGESTNGISSTIDPQLMDDYAKDNFPLCMRNIHENFRKTHSLKYGCRLQYGFFCKGIGLSYEGCVDYWKGEMTKLIEGNVFEKRYAYTIKHNYGKVGSKINYLPYDCEKICSSNVGVGEQHGCPYKLWDNTHLKDKLTEYGFNTKKVEEIEELAENGQCQLACSKYFECIHGKSPQATITHPNQYFEESLNLNNEVDEIFEDD